MYNKLFTKILDSSIWLAPDPHRLVWITLIAAMDEEGNAMFASAGNLAARARVTREQAESAVASFEGPDPDSGDPDNDGRRIERFPGGWHLLNAHKYRALVTKAIIQAQTRERVAKHRAKAAGVTLGNAPVTHEQRTGNAQVTPSEAVSVSEEKPQTKTARKRAAPAALVSVSDLVAEGVDKQHATDWMVSRKAKGLPLTPTAWAGIKSEAIMACMTPGEAINAAAGNGWAGFKAAWMMIAPAILPPQRGPAAPNTTTPCASDDHAEELLRQHNERKANATKPPAALVALVRRHHVSDS